MLTNFIAGFEATGKIIACIAGGVSAFVCFAATVLLVCFLASTVFDLVTAFLAKRWAKAGRKPRNRFERIILEHNSNNDGSV